MANGKWITPNVQIKFNNVHGSPKCCALSTFVDS